MESLFILKKNAIRQSEACYFKWWTNDKNNKSECFVATTFLVRFITVISLSVCIIFFEYLIWKKLICNKNI